MKSTFEVLEAEIERSAGLTRKQRLIDLDMQTTRIRQGSYLHVQSLGYVMAQLFRIVVPGVVIGIRNGHRPRHGNLQRLLAIRLRALPVGDQELIAYRHRTVNGWQTSLVGAAAHFLTC